MSVVTTGKLRAAMAVINATVTPSTKLRCEIKQLVTYEIAKKCEPLAQKKTFTPESTHLIFLSGQRAKRSKTNDKKLS